MAVRVRREAAYPRYLNGGRVLESRRQAIKWSEFCASRASPAAVVAIIVLEALSLTALPTLSAVAAAEAKSPSQQGPRSLDALLHDFALMPGLSARFREERRLALLKEPLVSHGALHFAPPNLLVRHVEEPLESTVLLRGDALLISTPAGDRTFRVDTSTLVRAFVDTFLLLLSGDAPALREIYRIHFEPVEGGATGEWRIRLEPRRAPLSEVVAFFDLRGIDRRVMEMRLRELSGDETLTQFSDVNTDRRFSESEFQRLFSAPKQ
jgi:hypothetical protein